MLSDMATKSFDYIVFTFSFNSVRDCLVGMLLLTGGGIRGHAVTNMTVGELKSAKQTRDGHTTAKASQANEWIKREVLSQYGTVEKLDSLTAKDWRTGWSNWFRRDPQLAQTAPVLLCHTPGTCQSNYIVPDSGEATKLANSILSQAADQPEPGMYILLWMIFIIYINSL